MKKFLLLLSVVATFFFTACTGITITASGSPERLSPYLPIAMAGTKVRVRNHLYFGDQHSIMKPRINATPVDRVDLRPVTTGQDATFFFGNSFTYERDRVVMIFDFFAPDGETYLGYKEVSVRLRSRGEFREEFIEIDNLDQPKAFKRKKNR